MWQFFNFPKKYLSVLFLIVFVLFSNSIFSQKLQAYFYYSPFYYSQQGPFIETYLTVVGNTVDFEKNPNGKLQSKLEVVMLFKQDGKIKDFRKYNLLSPEVADSVMSFPNFIDQQRISLKNGTYIFDLSIRDLNDTADFFQSSQAMTIDFNDTDFAFSGIELVESYKKTEKENVLSKNGFDIVPYVSDFYPNNLDRLIFYNEFYNIDKVVGADQDYLLKYYIENQYTKTAIAEFAKTKKQKSGAVAIVFGEFNIEKLPSGNYNIVIELRDRENTLLQIKKFNFGRSKTGSVSYTELNVVSTENTFVDKMTNIDTLREYIRCLRPISDNLEVTYGENQVAGKNIDNMRRFFLGFWLKRSADNPEAVWANYLQQVKMVNKFYSTQIRKGYETDRGRVYLQYGAPNTITDRTHEPNSYPYEIWQYNVVKGETNKKFVFYNPDIVGDDYMLLHSDVKGEIYTKNWQVVLDKRSTPIYDFEQKQGTEHYGGSSDELYKNPH